MNTNYDRPTMDEYLGGYNPDTGLLAAELHSAWSDAIEEKLPIKDAWYRVAARAKELRA